MKLINSITLYFFIFSTFLFTGTGHAQVHYCTYNFTRNLVYGDSSYDIYELQKFLNSDERSLISQSGPGSPGKETKFFGLATSKALKKFQSLQNIETQTPGELDSNTRSEINKICYQNKLELDKQKKVQASLRSTSTKPLVKKAVVSGEAPTVELSTFIKEFERKQYIKVALKTNIPVETPTDTSFIINGAKILSIRKTEPTIYSVYLQPEENSKKIYLQVEAEKIKSHGNRLNESASNALELLRVPDPEPPAEEVSLIDSLLPSAASFIFKKSTTTYTLFDKKSMLNFFNEINKNYDSTDLVSLSNSGEGGGYGMSSGNSVFASLADKIYVGAESVKLKDYKNFTQALSMRDLSKDKEIAEKYLLFDKIEYLKPIPNNKTWHPSEAFDRALLKNKNLNCSMLFTYSGQNIVALFERPDSFEFKLTPVNTDGMQKLLLYLKSNYDFHSRDCFIETNVTPRYFPEGLFCCTQEPCNAKENLTPITYLNTKNQIQRAKFVYTTTALLDKYGSCGDVPRVQNIRKK
jgi:hypothetical protein